jgi:hypothetical protein
VVRRNLRKISLKNGFYILFSNNQRLQRLIVGRWQVFKSFSGPTEPIINYANTQKTYGIRSAYGKIEEFRFMKIFIEDCFRTI